MKKKNHLINVLKVIAIFLVFNSHCGKLYPVSYLATGGALGNALFFVISGYLFSIKQKDNFFSIMKKRILQLYPPMIIVSVIYAILFNHYSTGVLEFISDYVWPTGYWFIGGLLLFNILVIILEKLRVFDHFNEYSICMCVIYFLYYILFIDKSVWSVEEHGLFRLIYYFYIYSFGYCLRNEKISLKIQDKLYLLIPVTFISSILWKLIMTKITVLMTTQCLCQIFGIVFAILSLQFCLDFEYYYHKIPKKAIRVFDVCSKYSLEVYLTQRTAQHLAQTLIFPINMVIAIIITVFYSILLKYILSNGIKKFSKLFMKI